MIFSTGNFYTPSGPRIIKVAMIAISVGMATFFTISQSGSRITPGVMTAAIPEQVCYHSNLYETGPRSPTNTMEGPNKGRPDNVSTGGLMDRIGEEMRATGYPIICT